MRRFGLEYECRSKCGNSGRERTTIWAEVGGVSDGVAECVVAAAEGGGWGTVAGAVKSYGASVAADASAALGVPVADCVA